MDLQSRFLTLAELWTEAADVHAERPYTRSAALAASAVAREDRRRRQLGIPSIFDSTLVASELPRELRGEPTLDGRGPHRREYRSAA